MFAFLTGEVFYCGDEYIVLMVGKVGFKVFVNSPIIESCSKGEKLSLYIHTNVRENSIDLYGFKTEEELNLFEKLVSISSIGPKTALSILSYSVEEIQNAIQRGDIDFLSTARGLGKKGAKRIVIELKDKISTFDFTVENSEYKEAQEALSSMGYKKSEITPALKEAKKEGGKTVGDLIKIALKYLSK